MTSSYTNQRSQGCVLLRPAGFQADRVAKAVVLRDEYGYVLAILPASHHIRLQDLRMQLGLDVDLAAEYEIEELFDDCVPGAIPPVGECYGLEDCCR